MIHPKDPNVIAHTALVNTTLFIAALPNLTPIASAPNPAAISSYVTEPIRDNLIHESGPPIVTIKDTIPASITIEGPIDDIALLLMADFICSSVIPISLPVL